MAAMATLAQPLAGTATTVCSSHSFNNHTGNKQVTVKGSFAAGRMQSVQQQQQQQSASKAVRFVVRAAEEEGTFPAEGAEGNSVVAEVAMLAEEPDTDGVGNAAASASASTSNKMRKASPLQKGGTLDGKEAEGKDPAAATLGKTSPMAAMAEGKFNDPRWRAGTWDISQFTKDGKTNWDAVIDAGMPNNVNNPLLFLLGFETLLELTVGLRILPHNGDGFMRISVCPPMCPIFCLSFLGFEILCELADRVVIWPRNGDGFARI